MESHVAYLDYVKNPIYDIVYGQCDTNKYRRCLILFPLKADPSVHIDPDQEEKRRGLSFWQPSHPTQQQLNLITQGHAVDQSQLSFPSVLVESLMVSFLSILGTGLVLTM